MYTCIRIQYTYLAQKHELEQKNSSAAAVLDFADWNCLNVEVRLLWILDDPLISGFYIADRRATVGCSQMDEDRTSKVVHSSRGEQLRLEGRCCRVQPCGSCPREPLNLIHDIFDHNEASCLMG